MIGFWYYLCNALERHTIDFKVIPWCCIAHPYCARFSCHEVVQSLNSPFFPPHIGTEPGRAKEESRITCMRMLRTPPFFPPKSGEKPYLEIFSWFCLWRDFLITYKQQFLHSDWIKTCQLIPNQWNFTSATVNHIRFVFLSQYQR